MRKHKQIISPEAGLVSIFTVLMFTILLSILTIGFFRLMAEGQNDTLKDDLSKTAYNSAQAGVEDAKRAILYCSSLTVGTAARTSCDTALYNQNCPGFNATNYFSSPLGIPQASTSGTLIGDTKSKQGYSCVIVTRNTANIKGTLTVNKEGNSRMIALRTASPFSRVRVAWHVPGNGPNSDGDPTIPASGTFVNATTTSGNPRVPHWPAGSPAAMRLSTISVPKGDGAFLGSDIRFKSFFAYPTQVSSPVNIYDYNATRRYETQCTQTGSFGGYSCAANIIFTNLSNAESSQLGNRYLVLQSLYGPTSYQVTAYNGNTNTPVLFDGVQPSIDATGYVNDVYRRIKVNVSLGADPLSLTAGVDTGLGLCKDFQVGEYTSVFDNANCE